MRRREIDRFVDSNGICAHTGLFIIARRGSARSIGAEGISRRIRMRSPAASPSP
jgi:hypothetical protein